MSDRINPNPKYTLKLQKRIIAQKKPVPAVSLTVMKRLKITEDRNAKLAAEVAHQKASERATLDTIFARNLELATALLSAVPFKYDKYIRKWIAKLTSLSTPREQANVFLSYMIIQIQTFKIEKPFDADPPQNLSEEKIAGTKINLMVNQMDKKRLHENLKEAMSPQSLIVYRPETNAPKNFFSDQIVPKDGLIA